MAIRVCLEEDYVLRTLKDSKKNDMAVIDSEGIPAARIQEAVKRGVYVYDYLNAGALERERSYYPAYKHLRIAQYEGWDGEYWVDVTAPEWIEHLVQKAKESKSKGCIGLYFDNTDIMWMCEEGFAGSKNLKRTPPVAADVFSALVEAIRRIRNETGLIVMPNGGDIFVRTVFTLCSDAKYLIQSIVQEGVFYEDFKKQSKSETAHRKAYVKWAQKNITGKVRIIEYCKDKKAIAQIKLYCAAHGWHLYVSRHTDLKGD